MSMELRGSGFALGTEEKVSLRLGRLLEVGGSKILKARSGAPAGGFYR